MKCPRCGLLNAPTAERCDCGRSFIDGSQSKPVGPVGQSGLRLRKAGCTTAVAAFCAVVVLQAMSSGNRSPMGLLLGVVGDLAMIIVVIGFIAWVIGALRVRRGV
jgi:hypothetical protein